MSMPRSKDSFSRGKARYKPQATVLVLCEDTKSAKDYLQEASQYFRAIMDFDHAGYTDPKGIVKFALTRTKQYDRVVCVIDRDTHHNFDEALDLARQSSKLELIVSYPCFEYWLLLHFLESRKPYTRVGNKSAAERLIDELCRFPEAAHYNKGSSRGLFASLLGEPFATARKRSPRLLADALRVKEMNPSTRLHDLISLMEELGKVQPT